MATIRSEATRLDVSETQVANYLGLSPNGEPYNPELELDDSALRIVAEAYQAAAS